MLRILWIYISTDVRCFFIGYWVSKSLVRFEKLRAKNRDSSTRCVHIALLVVYTEHELSTPTYRRNQQRRVNSWLTWFRHLSFSCLKWFVFLSPIWNSCSHNCRVNKARFSRISSRRVILFLCCWNVRTKLCKGSRVPKFAIRTKYIGCNVSKQGRSLLESYHSSDKRISEGRHYSAVIEWYFFRTIRETDDTIWVCHKKLWYHICGIKILRTNNQYQCRTGFIICFFCYSFI